MRRALTVAVVAAVTVAACRTWRPIETDDDFRRADQACAADDQVACGYLAESLRAAHRYERASRLAYASCDAGTAVGCASLGLFLADGLGDVPQDKARAVALLDFACQKGLSWGCADLGMTMLELDDPTPEQLARAAAALELGCDGGSLMGCTNLGHMLSERWHGHLDPVRARAVLLAACDAGSTPSCRRAGLSLLDSRGGPADPDAGYLVLEAACLRRDARACGALGERDEDLESTMPRARRAFRVACAADSRYGCAGLANSLLFIDAGLDQWEGLDAAENACRHDEKAGCAILADFLLRNDLAPDASRARRLAENSCDAGWRYGCFVRSRIDDGGLPWLRLAAQWGWSPALGPYLSLLESTERRAEAARLCDAGVEGACGLPDGGAW